MKLSLLASVFFGLASIGGNGFVFAVTEGNEDQRVPGASGSFPDNLLNGLRSNMDRYSGEVRRLTEKVIRDGQVVGEKIRKGAVDAYGEAKVVGEKIRKGAVDAYDEGKVVGEKLGKGAVDAFAEAKEVTKLKPSDLPDISKKVVHNVGQNVGESRSIAVSRAAKTLIPIFSLYDFGCSLAKAKDPKDYKRCAEDLAFFFLPIGNLVKGTQQIINEKPIEKSEIIHEYVDMEEIPSDADNKENVTHEDENKEPKMEESKKDQ